MKNTMKINILALICFVISISEFVIVGVLDKIAESVNISISAAGQLITVFAIAGAIGTPLAIMFMASMDRRKVLMISLALVVFGSIMMLISPNYALLLLARIILAVGIGVFLVTCFTVVAKLAEPERQARAISTLATGANAALILGLPMGRILTGAFGWKSIFWFTAVFSFISILLVRLTIPSTEGEEVVPIRKQLALLNDPKILLAIGISFFWIVGYSVPYSYITPFLKAISPMSEQMISIALLIFGIATLVGNKLGGYLGDSIGTSKTIIGGMMVQAVALTLLSINTGSTWIILIVLILWAIGVWAVGPVQQVNIMSLAPEASGIILSLNNSIIQLAFAGGSVIGGIVVGGSSILTLSWTGAAFAVITVVIAFASFKFRSPQNSLEMEL